MEGFDRILCTNENWGKWLDMVAPMLQDIISGEIKLENMLSKRVFEWLVYETKKLFVGSWSL